MALIICPECKKEISNKSDKCIHCGYPLNAKPIKSTKTSYGRVSSLFSLIILFFFLWIAIQSNPSNDQFKSYLDNVVYENTDSNLLGLLIYGASKLTYKTYSENYLFFSLHQVSIFGQDDPIVFVGAFGGFLRIE